MLPTITVDIGTTSTKLCVFDADAEVVAAERVRTPTVEDGFGEVYDADALQGAVAGFIRGLDPSLRATIERVAITGVGESGGLVAADLSLTSPLILWHDQRGLPRLARLDAADRERVYEITGLPASGNYALSKTAWALDLAGPRASGAMWLNVSEYLAALMTGERWAEPSLASRTMALDVRRGSWSDEMCALFAVDPAVLPPLRKATEGVQMSAAYAAKVGLPPSVAVHVAGHDHMVGAVGADVQPGELLNSTGTTEGLLFLRDTPRLDGDARVAKLANGRAAGGPHFTLFASIPTGGSAFATLQTLLEVDAATLEESIEDLHRRYIAGRIDLDRVPVVLPRFRGSPPPTKDPAARGIIAGIRTDTRASDIVLGCFLGMALQFRDVYELFGAPAATIKVIGPAGANPLWQQLKSDILDTPLIATGRSEVVSRGAQALASNVPVPPDGAAPLAITPDPVRHERLAQWADAIRPQWEYLKGYPS